MALYSEKRIVKRIAPGSKYVLFYHAAYNDNVYTKSGDNNSVVCDGIVWSIKA